jgi:hypothetical protein
MAKVAVVKRLNIDVREMSLYMQVINPDPRNQAHMTPTRDGVRETSTDLRSLGVKILT